MGVSILVAIAAGIAAVAIIVLICLTIKKLKELIKKRLDQSRKSKVAFGSTRKIVNEHAREILAQAPSMTMADLEDLADETPYFIVDYDPETDEESDLATIQAESVEENVETLLDKNDGIVLFN